jgi:DNA repair protein RadC
MPISKNTINAINKALNLIKDENPSFYDVNKKSFSSSKVSKDFFNLKLAALEREVFEVAFLDNQHKLIDSCSMFKGTIDCAAVYPREIIKKALYLNASAVILGHNHPSGVATPSEADKQITTRITDALRLVDIRVLDHLIIGHVVFSFAESGLI